MVPEQNVEDLEELELFIGELKEQIAMLERGVQAIKDDSRNKIEKGIDNMRIASHTIKGSARTFGFNPIGKLGQILEQTFIQIKEGNLSATHPSLEEFIKTGLEALHILADDLANQKKESIDADEYIEKMKLIITQPIHDITANRETPEQFKEKKLPRILEEASNRGLRVYEINGTASNFDAASVSAMQLKKRLEIGGKVAFSSPLSASNGSQNGQFILIFVTHETDSFIKTQASTIQQIRTCQTALLNAGKVVSVVKPVESPIAVSTQTFSALQSSQETIILNIQMKENAFASSVRVLQILRTLKKLGELIKSVPSEEELGRQKRVTSIQVWLKTVQPKEVVKQSLMSSVMDIENISVAEEQQKPPAAQEELSQNINPSLIPKLLKIANQLRERSEKLRILKEEAAHIDPKFSSKLASATADIESLTGIFRHEVRGIVLAGVLNTVYGLPEQFLDVCDSLRKELSTASTKDTAIDAEAIEKLAGFVSSLEKLLNEITDI